MLQREKANNAEFDTISAHLKSVQAKMKLVREKAERREEMPFL